MLSKELREAQREMLQQLTECLWLLNAAVEKGTTWCHPAAGGRPRTYVINPSDLTTCLSNVVSTDPPS